MTVSFIHCYVGYTCFKNNIWFAQILSVGQRRAILFRCWSGAYFCHALTIQTRHKRGASLEIWHCLVFQRRWDKDLHWIQLAFEAHGKTPVSLMFGYEVPCPLSNRWDLADLFPYDKVDIKENLAEALLKLTGNHKVASRIARSLQGKNYIRFTSEIMSRVIKQMIFPVNWHPSILAHLRLFFQLQGAGRMMRAQISQIKPA